MAVADIFIKKLLNAQINLFFLVAIREILGFFLLLLYVCVSAPHLLKINRRALPILIVYGIVGVGLLHFFGIWSVQKNDISIGITILYTSPLFILGFSFIRREQVHVYEVLTALMVLLGFALTFQAYNAEIFLSRGTGLLVGCGAAMLFAFSTIWGQKCVRQLNPLTVAVYGLAFGSLFWLFLGWLVDLYTWEHSVETWAQLAMVALLATLFIPILYLLGLRSISAAEGNLTASLEAVFAVGLSCVIFKEHLESIQWIGLGLIIGGVSYLQLRSIILNSAYTKGNLHE